jgi:hypothetical protein
VFLGEWQLGRLANWEVDGWIWMIRHMILVTIRL